MCTPGNIVIIQLENICRCNIEITRNFMLQYCITLNLQYSKTIVLYAPCKTLLSKYIKILYCCNIEFAILKNYNVVTCKKYIFRIFILLQDSTRIVIKYCDCLVGFYSFLRFSNS